jgi:hypothetical protein
VSGLQPVVDVFALRSRVNYLMDNFEASSYQIRKSKVHKDLESFLGLIGKDIAICAPDDICLYLAWADGVGKTAVHVAQCPDIGRRSPSCVCPRRLAYGTVASKISQLKNIFERLGKPDRWLSGGSKGNPVLSDRVSIYLNQIRQEQSKAHVSVLQAKPLFISKLNLISMYIDRQLGYQDLSLSAKFVLARDQSLLKLMFFGGDRAHDAGLMLTQEVKELPGGSAFVIKHTWGKTHRVDNPNIFSVFSSKLSMVCPVLGLRTYFKIASTMSVNLSTGYLFRPILRQRVLDRPLSYEATYQRLKHYLRVLGTDEGETPHSLRGGCAISIRSLSLQPVSSPPGLEAMMQHIGWSGESSAKHYARSDKLDQAFKMAAIMASSSFEDWKRVEKEYVEESELPSAFPHHI